MERALIVGSSGGIGAAVAETLDARGLELTRISRRREGFDITDPASVERHLGPLKGPYDLILIASGILAPSGAAPEKSLEQIDAAVLARVMAVNAIGPALVMRHVPRLLPPKGRSVVAVLTARVGSIGDNTLGGWYSYRASKAAANQIVRTAAIEIGRRSRDAIVVALHPGTVATDFTRAYPNHNKVPAGEAARNLLKVIESLAPSDTGRFFDWAGKEVPW